MRLSCGLKTYYAAVADPEYFVFILSLCLIHFDNMYLQEFSKTTL